MSGVAQAQSVRGGLRRPARRSSIRRLATELGYLAEELPFATSSEEPLVVHPVMKGEDLKERFGLEVHQWAEDSGFSGKDGEWLLVPVPGGRPYALFGIGDGSDKLVWGWLPRKLPKGKKHCIIEWPSKTPVPEEAAELHRLAFGLGAYTFKGYMSEGDNASSQSASSKLVLSALNGTEAAIVRGAWLARDLVNMPASHLGPAELEASARSVAQANGATVEVITDAALETGFPLIHAVGKAARGPERAPRLVDIRWRGPGASDSAPKVALVGKGVVFDTGGLDIKPPSNMLAMKKDMGGAANVLGLAAMIMESKLPIQLRVLVPIVENAIGGNAFRPSDVIKSRKGITVEIGNTDAEGRLILADALALADEEEPDIMIDMATLTGAHRVALGWDLPGIFTDDDQLASEIAQHGHRVGDPSWRLPLWKPYGEMLKSKVADTNNIPDSGFGGAITAALFLQKFVQKTKSWVHVDFNSMNKASSKQPDGGADQAIRSIYAVLAARYGH